MKIPKNAKYLRGGIGDILLRLDNIKPDEFYFVVSHFDQAGDLIKPLTSNFQYIPMLDPSVTVPDEVEPVTYPRLPIPDESLKLADEVLDANKTYVGLHPLGSKISRAFDSMYGRPSKFMPKTFIDGVVSNLVSADVEVLLFCAPDETTLFKDIKNVTIVCHPNIWDCFAFVSKCSLVIGTDSAIKTVSAILHIPTIVVLGDYKDPGRDIFIKPYKEITTIPFTNISNVTSKVVETAKNLLSTTH